MVDEPNEENEAKDDTDDLDLDQEFEQATPRKKRKKPTTPESRRLRVFAFDPLLSNQLDTLGINEITVSVPWEEDLKPGPSGEYLEVIDHDPAGKCFYAPIDLNHPHILARDGLAPSEGNPQFHQQMVYAIAMTTIGHFERALGRKANWQPRLVTDAKTGKKKEEYVQKLRIYPHALREANAYYSPDKRALLFGYFPASSENAGRNLPGGIIFTCLSHDVVAHETTHALLDGMHHRFIEASNPDVLAFHEAFADIVALMQHFSYPGVLRHQIAKTRGDLASQNLLGQLAQQFGEAVGGHGALRDALGQIDKVTNLWTPAKPDPSAYRATTEPHKRGSILVAAVFDAFLSIYRTRIADLLRIATNGSGQLPTGELHPDLVGRLATEAHKSAEHVLLMCIRALDYCPPVDLTFGEYLRALITADTELVANDDRGYRVAIIEAFRQRGLYPTSVRSLAADSLIWQGIDDDSENGNPPIPLANLERTKKIDPQTWKFWSDRRAMSVVSQRRKSELHSWIARLRDENGLAKYSRQTGLALARNTTWGIDRDKQGNPIFEIHAVYPSRRVGPDGELTVNLIIEITQKRKGFRDPGFQAAYDNGEKPKDSQEDFTFRGGCTLVYDMDSGELRYVIKKDMLSEARLARQREFLFRSTSNSMSKTYFGARFAAEPFAMLHRDA